MLVSRTRQKLEGLKGEIEAEGGRAWVYAADLSNLEACERVGRQVLDDHGQVDVLVNNAGRSIRRSLVQQLDRGRLDLGHPDRRQRDVVQDHREIQA